MFYRHKHKIKSLTKTANYNRLFITIIFIFSFLLILFNKTDYLIVNKIKSASIDVITPVTAFITAPVKVVVNISEEINEIRYLKNQNSKLKEEVLRLKKWQTLALKNQRENIVYKKLLNSTSSNVNIVKTASIISKSSGIYSKTVVINAGLSHGISEDLTIINERGLVGKIVSVTNNNSKVMLIIDQNSSVPVKTMSNVYAIITGTTGGKILKSSFLNDEKKPKPGDLLLTSGNAKIFPKDIIVGKVIEVNENGFIALPYVDFNNLDIIQAVNTS